MIDVPYLLQPLCSFFRLTKRLENKSEVSKRSLKGREEDRDCVFLASDRSELCKSFCSAERSVDHATLDGELLVRSSEVLEDTQACAFLVGSN